MAIPGQYDPLAGLMDFMPRGQEPVQNWGGFPLQADVTGGQALSMMNKPPDIGMTGMDKWGVGLGTAQTALGAYMGYNQHKLAKKQFNFQKNAFNEQMGMQKTELNRQLGERFDGAERFNPGSMGDRDQYMDKWGY